MQSQSGEIGPGDLSASPSSDSSVTENTPDVNTQSTQGDVQYALAPNQFANKTAQRMTTISEEVKSLLMGRGARGDRQPGEA